MNYNINQRLEQIKIENYIWIIYLIIIGLSYYANYFEKDYFINKNVESKEKYRKINAIIFSALIIIYGYFENDAIKSYISNKDDKYNKLILIASTAILISGFIFLYIIIDDSNLETELAFN